MSDADLRILRIDSWECQLNCPRCNAPIPEGASFCSSCGAPLATLPYELAPPRRTRSRAKVMVAALALFIIAFIAVAAVGTMLQNSGDSGADGPPAGGERDGLPDASPSNVPAVDSVADISLSGSGDTVTERFELSSGVAIFRMTYSGPSNFIVTLYSSAGEYVDLVANEIGAYSGNALVGVAGGFAGASEGEHYLEVSASGPWEIVIEHPRASSASSVPATITGNGDDVPEPFEIPSGPVQFTMNHEGASNFIVTLYDADGRYVDLLANEVGAYSGSKSVGSGGVFGSSPGIHYIDVNADGDWSVEITEI